MTRRSILAVLFTFVGTLTAIDIAMAQGADTKRRTVAVTYLRDPVRVVLAGTTRRPEARGEATVERWRKRNESEIDIKLEELIPAFNYGSDYNTYVLWAVTPAGQVDNLGEFRLSGGSARLKTATPHQTFALIVTAEPHYLVRLPSKMVVLENLAPASKNAQVQVTDVYFTGDSGKYYSDDRPPAVAERDYNKTPMELLQARRAVQIARLADGERFDPTDYNASLKSLQLAEDAFRRGANVHEVGRIAREAISLAVRTRDIAEEKAVAAERRAEIARRDEEVRRATDTASDLQTRLSDTEARLRASEIARTNNEEQLRQAMREAADSRAELRQLRAENDRMARDLESATAELKQTRTRVADLESQFSTANNKLETIEKIERERERAEARRRDFVELQSSLRGVVTVKPNGSGFVASLPDSFFVPNKTELALKVKTKMDALAQALAAHPDAFFVITGHSDPRPTADEFALGRAQSVADYISALGVSPRSFKVESRGATSPLNNARTAAARATNRRVEIIFLSPEQNGQ